MSTDHHVLLHKPSNLASNGGHPNLPCQSQPGKQKKGRPDPCVQVEQETTASGHVKAQTCRHLEDDAKLDHRHSGKNMRHIQDPTLSTAGTAHWSNVPFLLADEVHCLVWCLGSCSVGAQQVTCSSSAVCFCQGRTCAAQALLLSHIFLVHTCSMPVGSNTLLVPTPLQTQ
jgi:hypothetical protein